ASVGENDVGFPVVRVGLRDCETRRQWKGTGVVPLPDRDNNPRRALEQAMNNDRQRAGVPGFVKPAPVEGVCVLGSVSSLQSADSSTVSVDGSEILHNTWRWLT